MKTSFLSCVLRAALIGCAAIALASQALMAQSDAKLQAVLNAMDRAQQNFHSAEANFVWDVYTAVVQETDTQKGKVYYRRQGNEIQMALEVTDPTPKYVLLMGGRLQFFEPRLNRVTLYDTKKNQAAFESFLALGFGGGGHAMEKSYDIQSQGIEKVEGIDTDKLQLTPKSEKVKNMFPRILLWIDPTRGVSVQQQLFQQDGDYRLAKYSDIQLNRKIPDSAFKLKTDSKTVVQGSAGEDAPK